MNSPLPSKSRHYAPWGYPGCCEIAPEYLAIIQDKVTQEEGQLISYKLQPQMDIPQLGFYQV